MLDRLRRFVMWLGLALVLLYALAAVVVALLALVLPFALLGAGGFVYFKTRRGAG